MTAAARGHRARHGPDATLWVVKLRAANAPRAPRDERLAGREKRRRVVGPGRRHRCGRCPAAGKEIVRLGARGDGASDSAARHQDPPRRLQRRRVTRAGNAEARRRTPLPGRRVIQLRSGQRTGRAEPAGDQHCCRQRGRDAGTAVCSWHWGSPSSRFRRSASLRGTPRAQGSTRSGRPQLYG